MPFSLNAEAVWRVCPDAMTGREAAGAPHLLTGHFLEHRPFGVHIVLRLPEYTAAFQDVHAFCCTVRLEVGNPQVLLCQPIERFALLVPCTRLLRRMDGFRIVFVF